MIFWSCDTSGIIINITWCQQHHQWDHGTHKPRWLKWGTTCLFGSFTLLAPSLASHGSKSVVIVITWHQWCHQWHNYTPLVKTTKIRYNMTFLSCNTIGTQWHCPQHQMMPMTSSMTPLHSLYQENVIEAYHDFLIMWHHFHQQWCHMVLKPALVSYDASDIINGIIAFLRSRQLMPLVPVSHGANRIINGTCALLMLRWLKYGATWLFWSCETIDASISSMWYK